MGVGSAGDHVRDDFVAGFGPGGSGNGGADGQDGTGAVRSWDNVRGAREGNGVGKFGLMVVSFVNAWGFKECLSLVFGRDSGE